METTNFTKYPDFNEYYDIVYQTISLRITREYEEKLKEHVYTLYRLDLPTNKATVIVESLISNFKLA